MPGFGAIVTRTAAIVAGVVLAVPALATGQGAALAATRRVSSGAALVRQAASLRMPASGRRLSAGRAQALAKATGRPVVASALTSAMSQTMANPDGSFTLAESVRPVRAWRHGRWLALNPSLHRNGNGTVSPAVTVNAVTLSGGGSGALAVVTTAGRTLTLSWPGTLPAPVISGSTATYPDVLMGVDLVVTVDSQGDVSDVLVVKSASAAASPALASLRLGASAPGLAVTADSAGNLRVAASATAQPVFTAPVPQMWDSAPPPSGATIAGSGGTAVVTPADVPAYSSVAGPGAGAHTGQVGVSVTGGAITLSPSASVLAGAGVVYPVYIDPMWYPVAGGLSWSHEIASYSPGSTNVNTGGDLQVGLCDFAFCNNGGGWVARSLFAMTIPTVLRGAVIKDSNISMTDVAAASCTASGNSAQLWATGSAKSSTWNSKPNHQQEIEQEDFACRTRTPTPGQSASTAPTT
jgi:hypothetical protein